MTPEVHPENVEEYVARPIEHVPIIVDVNDLTLGFRHKGMKVSFDWKPYEKRNVDHRADYDRLVISVFHHGIRSPIITYKKHVLVGMRRVEIARKFRGIHTLVACEIQEDVTKWWQYDLMRLNLLKEHIGQVTY